MSPKYRVYASKVENYSLLVEAPNEESADIASKLRGLPYGEPENVEWVVDDIVEETTGEEPELQLDEKGQEIPVPLFAIKIYLPGLADWDSLIVKQVLCLFPEQRVIQTEFLCWDKDGARLEGLLLERAEFDRVVEGVANLGLSWELME